MNKTEFIDLDHLEKYVSGDAGLRDEILAIFSEQSLLLADNLEHAQTDEGWRDAAHSLKGAARGIGAWEIGELAEEAENLIGAAVGKLEKRAALAVAIRRRLDCALAEINFLRG